MDPGATDFPLPPGYQSSSDLSSPNENCYGFVRKAMQKFSTNKRPIALNDKTLTRFPWFSLSGLEQFSASMSAMQQMHGGDTQGEFNV